MDPDMVRQQEEEEAASRLLAPLAQQTPPPFLRAEEPSPQPRVELRIVTAPVTSAQLAFLRADDIAPTPRTGLRVVPESVPPAPLPPAPFVVEEAPVAAPSIAAAPTYTPRRRPAWRIALVCTFLTAAGVAAGAAAGMALHLTPLTGFLLAASAGYVLGWGGAVGWLRRSRSRSTLDASSAVLWPVAVVWITQLLTLAFATRYDAAAPLVVAETAIPIYWAIIAAGVVVSYILALSPMREAVSQ